jgi:probable phosphoglycerate mutase
MSAQGVATTRVVMIRHGETLWNRERRIQGQTDTPLSDLGRAQAAAVGERLAAVRFAALYASDLVRAWNTARAIEAAVAARALAEGRTGPPLRADARLREMHFGEWEGRTSAEIAAADPQAHARSRERDPDFRIPGGESFRDLYARAVAAVSAHARAHAGETIGIIAHGGILDMLYRHTHGIPLQAPRVFSLYNAAYNCLTHDEAGFRLEAWGDTAHLDALSDAVVS